MLQDKRTTLIRNEVAKHFKIDIDKQKKNHIKDLRRFWTLSGKLLIQEGRISLLSEELSKGEKRKRMEENNATYYDKNLDIDIKSYKKIKPENKFQYNITVDDVGKMIDKTKNIDGFIKVHSLSLKKPIWLLNKLIEKVKYFPKNLRHSKMTMLPSRVIYSLGALPKLCEKILYSSMEECIGRYYSNHDDPGQMAYERNRGTASCNAISLANIESSLKISKESCIQICMDLKKAFNHSDRPTVLEEIHKMSGAGELFESWFKDRTFEFEGRK